MDLKNDIDWKSFIIGAAITAGIVIFASNNEGLDWLMYFASIGLLYVGWTAKNIKYGAVLGALAAIPLIYLALVMETFGNEPFYSTTTGIITVIVVFLIFGALIGVVGAWAKSSREKAKIEYEKQQKIGKNKNKKKKKNNN